jgi:moderate conductance mechanosensitive channel
MAPLGTQSCPAGDSRNASIVTVVIGMIVVVMAMEILGYPIGPLIASAGILGVALGFGAQNLVKDFLGGMFMLLEDQYGVGDVIDMGYASGTVEGVGLRVTRMRAVATISGVSRWRPQRPQAPVTT